MFALILLVIFGLGMAYFATQNTGVVHILLGSFLFSGIPLYVIVIGALLLGIFISWLISMTDSISTSLTIHGKEHDLKKAQEKIEKLEGENHTLSVEIARLKGLEELEEVEKHEVKESQNLSSHPSFFQHMRQSFS